MAKALGAPPGCAGPTWRSGTTPGARPLLRVRGTVADAARRLGVRHWHVSLTHDGGVSVAFVVAESRGPGNEGRE